MDKKKLELQALKAITAFRHLDIYGLMTDTEKKKIKKRLMKKYSEYLSPLRTDESK